MSSYGPIAYEDMALLNAQWQQARPAVHGLGSVFGQHEYRDLSYLNARLRPIFPAEVGMPPPSSIANNGVNGVLSGNSLGADGKVVTLPEVTVYGDPNAPTNVFAAGGGTNWMLWGGAIAAIAVGGALMYRASKKR